MTFKELATGFIPLMVLISLVLLALAFPPDHVEADLYVPVDADVHRDIQQLPPSKLLLANVGECFEITKEEQGLNGIVKILRITDQGYVTEITLVDEPGRPTFMQGLSFGALLQLHSVECPKEKK